MKKILNDRPLFYCFLAFGFGILLAKPIFSFNIVISIISVLVLLSIGCLCVRYKKIVSLILVCVCFFIGILSFYLSTLAFNVKDFGSNEKEITGRVAVSTIYESSQSVILDNVIIEGEKISENVKVNIFNSADIQEGMILTFSAKLTKTNLFTLERFNSYNYKNNIPYNANVNFEDITIDNQSILTWSERLRANIKSILFSNMNNDEASVSYASLFGDKTYIESDIKSNFSISGIAHLLAVSGLHVGFLVTFISLALKKLKINKYIKTIILVAILGMYAYLCNFSPSVLRASIMFFVLNLSGLLGKRYDRLNAWSLAGILCLLYKPLSVYDGGFLLSFASVLCIFMFAKPIEQKLIKWHIPKSLSGTLGVMIPVQFGLIPLLSMYYTEMSLLSIITNFICVPIFEIFFILLFVCSILTMIMPFLAFLLTIPQLIIQAILEVSKFVAGLEFAIINLSMLTGLVVVFAYVVMFIFSHYVNLKLKTKTFLCLFLCVSSLAVAIVQTYPLNPQKNKITLLNASSEVYFLEIDNKSLAIGNFDSYSIDLVQRYSVFSRLYGVDYFISLNSSLPDVKIRGDLFKNIYSVKTNLDEYKLQNEQTLENGIAINQIKVGGVDLGLGIFSKNLQILIHYNKTATDFSYLELASIYGEFDLILCKSKYVEKLVTFVPCKYSVIDGRVFQKNGENKSKFYGNWTFSLKNNIITDMRGVD